MFCYVRKILNCFLVCCSGYFQLFYKVVIHRYLIGQELLCSHLTLSSVSHLPDLIIWLCLLCMSLNTSISYTLKKIVSLTETIVSSSLSICLCIHAICCTWGIFRYIKFEFLLNITDCVQSVLWKPRQYVMKTYIWIRQCEFGLVFQFNCNLPKLQ